MATTKDWGETVDGAIAGARRQNYKFWRRGRDNALARFKSTRDIELLVEGKWVLIVKPPTFHKWQRLNDDDLRAHAEGFLVDGFGDARGKGQGPHERLRCLGLLRWAFPPLPGGAKRRVENSTISRVCDHRAVQLPPAKAEDLEEMREEALRGHLTLAERCMVLEQRANFFLGATGLTSSLVLANSGLLLGTAKLSAPWLGIAIACLALSSLCAVIAGVCAMQAAMTTFVRATPSSVTRISERAGLAGQERTRAYVGALFVAQNREEVVGNWKMVRLKSARNWFLATVVGISLLTMTVLMDAAV